MVSNSLTLREILRRSARRDPSKTAITHFRDGVEVTAVSYEALFLKVNGLGNALLSAGLEPGDKIAVLAESSLEFCQMILATANAGMIAAPINVQLTPQELTSMLTELKPGAVVGDDKLLEQYSDAIGSSGFTGPRWRLSTDSSVSVGPTDSPMSRMLADVSIPDVNITAEDPCLILYTSGSTGRSRGVVLSHGSMVMNSWNSLVCWGIRSTDRVLLGLPLYHISMLNTTFLPTLQAGATAVIVNRLNATSMFRQLHDTRATVTLALPYMYKAMLDEAAESAAGFPPLRLALYGMAGMPDSLAHRLRHELGAAMMSGFGQTESGGNTLVLTDREHDEKCGSIGRPVDNTEVELLGRDGAPLPPRSGEVGELAYRGASMCLGYLTEHGIPEADDESWLRSGDLAYEDGDGYYWFQGRTRDVIKSGGENVYAAKVEQAIATIPGVVEVAVVGQPSERWGEEVVAYVVGDPGAVPTGEEIRNIARQRLAPFEVPKRVEFLARLPKSAAGKVVKRQLVDGTSD